MLPEPLQLQLPALRTRGHRRPERRRKNHLPEPDYRGLEAGTGRHPRRRHRPGRFPQDWLLPPERHAVQTRPDGAGDRKRHPPAEPLSVHARHAEQPRRTAFRRGKAAPVPAHHPAAAAQLPDSGRTHQRPGYRNPGHPGRIPAGIQGFTGNSEPRPSLPGPPGGPPVRILRRRRGKGLRGQLHGVPHLHKGLRGVAESR